MKTINILGVLFISLLMSCGINIDAKLASFKAIIKDISQSTQSTTQEISYDSASYVNSILRTDGLQNEDSVKLVLKSLMEKIYIYANFKKNSEANFRKYHKKYNEDSLQVRLYCNDKPISFYFIFKDKQLYINTFDGLKDLSYKIDDISVFSLPNNHTVVYYSFGIRLKLKERKATWIKPLFSIDLYKDLPTWKLYACGTPSDEFKVYNYTTQEYIDLLEKVKIGCDSTLLPYMWAKSIKKE